MEINSKLTNSQKKQLYEIYTNFFNEINFKNQYTPKLVEAFAKRKVLDVKRVFKDGKYFFAIEDDKIIGFIHGKVYGKIGLVCHAFVLKEYRNKRVFFPLYKALVNWFKECGVTVVELEIALDNPIRQKVEKHNWQIVREFDDANVYQKNI